MPIYEYICRDCKNEFEVIRPMGQANVPMACASCGGENIKRKISVFYGSRLRYHYAESGGKAPRTSRDKAVAGASAPSCGSCVGGSCANCGH
jgi:putative FmdB family regulatory protein